MKTIFLFTAFLCLFLGLNAQTDDFSIKAGTKEKFKNSKAGYLTSIIGENQKYVYCYFSKGGYHYSYSDDSKVAIQAYDKTTMNKAYKVSLKGFKDKINNTKDVEDLNYYKTLIFDNVIYVFWKNTSRNLVELYVQSFNEKLEVISPLKKVYEVASDRADNKKGEIVVLGTKNGQVLIGAEGGSKKNENVKFSYRVLKSDLSFTESNVVELPIQVNEGSTGLTSSYEFGEDGNLYLKTYVTMQKEEEKGLGKGEWSTYCLFSTISLTNGTIKTFRIKYDRKNIYCINFTILNNAIQIYGFYTDLDNPLNLNKGLFKDRVATKTTQGIFSCSIDNKTFELNGNPTFAEFTNDQISKFKTKDAKSVSLLNYEILKIAKVNNDYVLFCTEIYPYSICSQKGGCSYFCQNENIVCFSMSNIGKINWVSFLERYWNYTGTAGESVYDVTITNKDNKYYIIYADQYYYDQTKGRRVSKSKKEKRNFMDYVILDPEKGTFKKSEMVINTKNTPKSEVRIVNAKDLVAFDNVYFLHKEVKLNAGAIVAKVILLPTILGFYIPNFISSSYHGTGYVGKINIK